jgi:hypothetical protein
MAAKKSAVPKDATITGITEAPSARFKDFGSAIRMSELPPLTFELCEQTFHCRPALQSRRLLQFVKEADGDSGVSAGEAIHNFMETVIVPEDVQAWKNLLDSDEYIVDVALLGNVVTWLVEQYSGRPTPQ